MKLSHTIIAKALLATALTGSAQFSAAESLIEHVEGTGEFTILLEALETAGLKEVLNGAGPYTLFAPNDAAFNKLRPATLKILLSPGNSGQLAEIMKYHVVEGNVDLATPTESLQPVISMLGQEIALSNADGISLNEESLVIQPGIVTDNGIIHVIDSVIFPE
jgi:uncharacterized surface protein with fasciclin (FAS1) repeats